MQSDRLTFVDKFEAESEPREVQGQAQQVLHCPRQALD